MGIAVLIIFYGSAIFCIVAFVFMMMRYARAPLHIHWELYKNSSAYELPDWWTRDRSDTGKKLKSMVLDILFLRDYYRRNRSFWYFLFLFHSGLYLLIIWHIWLFVSAPIVNFEDASSWGTVWGYVATSLVFIGAIGILIQRISRGNLRVYYPPIHYAKWIFVIIALAGGFYAVVFHFEGNMANVLAYVNEQLAFNLESKLHASSATSVHLLIVAPWLLYLPFSHIMTLFLRYYHHLRWDGKPNLKGGQIEKEIKKLLTRPVSWSAPHIQAGRMWGEVAQGMPEDKSEAR